MTEGAEADIRVQVDIVPEGNCSDTACRRSLDLKNRIKLKLLNVTKAKSAAEGLFSELIIWKS